MSNQSIKEFFKKLHTFDLSYKMFSDQAKAKKKWRDVRLREICQTANKKINPDMLIGAANKLKNAEYPNTYSKMELKFFNRKQAQEKIAHKAAQAEIDAQANLVLTHKHTSRPGTSHVKMNNNPHPIVYQAEFTDPQLFYHNDHNNSELKAFLNAKFKGQCVEDSKSRILYSSQSQVRPASAFYSRRSSPAEIMESTIYQTFAGAYRPNELSSRQRMQIDNPNLSNSLPKGWDFHIKQNNRYSTIEAGARVHTAGSEQMSTHRSRITKNKPRENYYDAESILNQAIEAKKRIQQQLQSESFANNNLKNISEIDSGNKRPTRDIRSNGDKPKTRSFSPKNALKQSDPKRTEENQAGGLEYDNDDISRKRISTKEDDNTHRIGDWSTLLKLIPNRIRKSKNTVNSSIDGVRDSKTLEGERKDRRELNRSIDFVKTTEGDKKFGRAFDRVMASYTQPTNRIQSASIHGPKLSAVSQSAQKQKETPSPNKEIQNLRYSSAEPVFKSTAADRAPKQHDIQRTRLYEYNIVQQFKRRGHVQGRSLTLEQEREKVLGVYEKVKKNRLRTLMIRK